MNKFRIKILYSDSTLYIQARIERNKRFIFVTTKDTDKAGQFSETRAFIYAKSFLKENKQAVSYILEEIN